MYATAPVSLPCMWIDPLPGVRRLNIGVTVPTHGAAIAAAVLNSPELRKLWEDELAEMRDRIKAMRHGLVEKLAAAGVKQDFAFIEKQRGMFSYSGLTAEQVERLQKEDGIYALSTGRICVAALNTKNIDKVAKAIARVLA